MSENQFGVYGKLVEPSSPLLTEKECLDISKCIDKTQLAVEIYEAVRRIRDKYENLLLDEMRNDSLRFELYQLMSAVAQYYRSLTREQDVSDAVALALELYRVHLTSKNRGFDVSRIINKAKMNPEDETKSGKPEYDLEHLDECGTWIVCMENLEWEKAVHEFWRGYRHDQKYRLLEHKSVWRIVSIEECKRRRE